MTPISHYPAARRYGRLLRLLFGLQALAIAADTRATEIISDEIARYVGQLGSRNFAEREKAVEVLEAIGEAALPLLTPGAQSADPDVRRRTGQLVRSIQRRLESSRVTAAGRVCLVYRNVPLAEAVADFNRKTGFSVQVRGDPNLLARRTVSLDTGEVTLWQALDQFCRSAGLAEWRALSEVDRARLKPFVNEKKEERPRLDFLPPNHHWRVGRAPEPLLLVPVSLPLLSCCEAGGIRVRALSHGTPGWGQTTGTRELACLLEVCPQPGIDWRATQEVRVRWAVDEQGQQLSPVPPEPAPSTPATVFAWRIAALKSSEMVGNLAQSNQSTVEVRLEARDKRSRRLQRLDGLIIGRMIAPPQPALTVEPILKASGQTYRRGPTSLRVAAVKTMTGGHVLLEVEVIHSPEENEAGGEPSLFPGNRFGPEDLRLQDVGGKDYEVVQGIANALPRNDSVLATSLTVLYRAGADQGDPAKLVLNNRRPIFVEVPFCLENVPLP